jgi:ABC-2 type transport system permease protein
MFRRVAGLIIKELIQLRRDWMFLFVILAGCATEMSAIAYATGKEIDNLPIAIYDYDRSNQSRVIVQTLANIDTFEIVEYSHAAEDVAGPLDRGEIYGVVIIPRDFETDLKDPTRKPQIQIILNGAESSAAERAQEVMEGALAKYGTSIVLQAAGLKQDEIERLEPSARVWFNEELRESNYTVPSELGFILYVIALWIAAIAIAKERELGTLEQLLVTPITRFELMLGKMIPAVLVSYVNFLPMLAIVVLVFKVPMRGSLPLLLALAFVYILVELQRGILISVFARTQQQGLLIVFMIAFVDMTFSGYMVPVESMPRVFQIASNFFPIRHWMIIMRGIMLKGVGLEVFWPHLLAILGLGLVLMMAALLAFNRVLGED